MSQSHNRPGMKRRPGALLTGMTFTLADDSALLTPIALGAVTAATGSSWRR